MKILTSLLLVFLLTRHTISFSSDSDEYAEEVNDSDEQKSVTTTTETTTTTTEEITTTTKNPISPEVEEFIDVVSTRFDDLKDNFLNKQQNVYDRVQADFENYKTLRDSSIKFFKDAYDHDLEDLNNHIKSIEAKKSDIEKSIEKIHDYTWIKEESSKKLEKKKERSKLLKEMKSGNCDDCDGFLDYDRIDEELKKNKKEIIELEEKIEKQKNNSEIRRRRLNDNENRQLNEKYVELIHVYEKEVEERKKSENLEFMNNIINNKWRKYAEKIGNLHVKANAKMEKLAKVSLKINELISNESLSSNDGEWGGINIPSDAFKWIPFDKHTSLPSDAVDGGKDADGTELYIIRSKKENYYLYGKIAFGSRKDSYVTNDDAETAESSIELLTSKNYVWCDAKTYKVHKNTPPVCKTIHTYESSWSKKEIELPGTLLADGKCRVGFAWKAHRYADNVKVLGFGSCNSPVSAGKSRFYF